MEKLSGYIEEDEWRHIVTIIFPKYDADTITKLIEDHI